jgi:hypothetical protein
VTKQKTVVEVFTEACAAFYRAISELDQVAVPRGGDLQHEAYKATGALQKTLDAAVKDWNGEEELPPVSLCAGADSWESWAAKCEKYAAGLEPGGYCTECLLAKGRA